MSAGELQQRGESGAHVSAGLRKAKRDIVADVRERKGRELFRNRLVEQWPPRIGKELLHDTRGRAGEGICRGLRLMLNHASDLSVGSRHGEYVLDFVKHDQAGRTAAVE